jgi:outer membrane lipoprotein-sorting protein
MKHRLRVSALCLLYASVAAAADDPATQSLPAAEEVVSRMAASDLHRQSSIDGYAGMRRYVLENRKLQKRAEMLVKVKGDADGTKHFEIVSEDGWKSANSHVLRKMLESETETSRPQVRATSKLNFTNYEFEILRVEVLAGRTAYVLNVKPKRSEKYLFQGLIWVDAEDYALVRAEGSPAKNPSFWTKSTHFVQLYKKAGPLWFPLSTQSVTEARIFGTTDVNIEYFDYAPQGRASSEITLATIEGMFKP